MIGNDVVDLRDADALPGARHPGFDARVFAPNERAGLASSEAPDRDRWILWAAKEAAYKVARKRDPKCVFSPSRFVVRLAGSSEGVVELGASRFPIHVTDSAGVVHVVATDAEVPADRLCAGVRELSSAVVLDSDAPSRAVRELAVSQIRSRWNVAGTVTVARAGRVPVLEVGGARSAVDLSLSHHGRWVAFACELPVPGRNPA